VRDGGAACVGSNLLQIFNSTKSATTCTSTTSEMQQSRRWRNQEGA